LFSVAANYGVGLLLGAVKDATPRRLILACGIILNLSILGYFKYMNFFVLQLNGVGQQLEWELSPGRALFFQSASLSTPFTR